MSACTDTGGVAFELDGQPVTARPGETILKAAQRHGVEIPHLLLHRRPAPRRQLPRLRGRDRGRAHAGAQLLRAPTEGMKVQAASPRARKSQQMVVEMLLSDMPDAGYRWNDQKANTPELIAGSAYPSSASGQFDSENSETMGQHGELSAMGGPPGRDRAPRTPGPAPRTTRAGPEPPGHGREPGRLYPVQPLRARLPREQVNDVIGYALRGADSKIVFDLDDPMAESTCVACGECVQACPTGALSPKTHIGSQKVRPQSRFGLPVLRCGLPHHLQRAR